MGRTVIIIAGPTCSGKTALSIKIAEKINTEIISADSRQVFKLLNIGTAKPSSEDLQRVKHHLIDFINPDQDFDANLFEQEAIKIISSLFVEKKVPVITGGSGLYIKAVVDGLYDTADKDQDYRKMLMQERELYGNEYLYQKLKNIDPESAVKMIPQNWKRVMRALEVFHISGKSILTHQKEYKRFYDMKFLIFGLKWKREVLYERINRRVDDMIASGLINEVKYILDSGYSLSLNSLNTVGYKEIISYLRGEYDLEKAVELIKRNTRRYAKRQLTWFSKDKRIQWFDLNDISEIDYIAGIICSSV